MEEGRVRALTGRNLISLNQMGRMCVVRSDPIARRFAESCFALTGRTPGDVGFLFCDPSTSVCR